MIESLINSALAEAQGVAMPQDTRPGPQAKYSKHIASNNPANIAMTGTRNHDALVTDAHSNPLGTVYTLKFPGGNVNCEFVCLGSYQASQARVTALEEEAELDTDVIALKEQVSALRNALEAAANKLDNACEFYSAQVARDVLNKIPA